MNVYTLMRAMKSALEATLPELPLATPGRVPHPEGQRAANVFIGDLPPKKPEGPDQEFPFVLLQAKTGHLTDTENMAEVLLRLGVYSREEGDNGEAAENDLSNLVSLVSRVLKPYAAAPLESRYVLEADGKGRFLFWERPDKQPQPYAEAWMISLWRMPA